MGTAMIKFDNKLFTQAFEAKGESKTRLAVMANSSVPSLDNILAANADSMVLSTLEKFADYLGLDVEVRFVKRVAAREPVEALV
jgi:hypothetical protein